LFFGIIKSGIGAGQAMRKFLEVLALVAKNILLWSAIAYIAFAIVVVYVIPNKPEAHTLRPAVAPKVSAQQSTAHMLGFDTRKYCTGTAIGPHALLTANHCDPKDEAVSVYIDWSTETHKIISSASDGRDHLILLIDGSPLTNIEKVAVTTAKIGEHVTIYGVGGGAYPPVVKQGVITDCQDPSDADHDAGVWCSSLHSIPGDSGSVVYNDKGQVVGIVTYKDNATEPSGTIGFALNFTEKQWADAAAFDGKHAPKPAAVGVTLKIKSSFVK
jgi:S1-C subfamily serine protease